MTSTPLQEPTNPRLAKLFHKHLEHGDDIRYVSDDKMVVFVKNEQGPGCAFLAILGLFTLGVGVILFLLLAGQSKRGALITYTVKPNGKIKTVTKPGQTS